MTPLVIAETNFVVGVVERRDDPEKAPAMARMVRLAREGRLRLAIPAFSLIEARKALDSAQQKWNGRAQELQRDERELARSPLSFGAVARSEGLRTSLVELESKMRNAYTETLDDILLHGDPIPLDGATIRKALLDTEHDLDLADSIVLQSTLDYLDRLDEDASPRRFLNLNTRDFNQRAIRDAPGRRQCELHDDPRGLLASLGPL